MKSIFNWMDNHPCLGWTIATFAAVGQAAKSNYPAVTALIALAWVFYIALKIDRLTLAAKAANQTDLRRLRQSEISARCKELVE